MDKVRDKKCALISYHKNHHSLLRITVYRLITQGTIEEKIVRLHHEKRDLADKLLEGTDKSTKLSAEELIDIFRT